MEEPVLYTFRPVANGLSTDHPIPDLPFVDDFDLPTEPRAIEAIGRKPGGTTWGRQDSTRDGGWAANTTIPERTDLAWYVRFHPDHGRSVFLVRNDEVAFQHQTFAFEMRQALLFRSGGYWWDGAQWFRPAQLWDQAGERIVARAVPGAATVSAADVLDQGADAARGRILTVAEFDPDASANGSWPDELALWATRRSSSRPLSACVVRLTAPELSGDQLIGAGEMAKLAGIAPSTLRAYNVRGEGDIPEPQAVVGGRNAWSRPVGAEWVEQRSKSRESATDAVSVDHDGVPMPVGTSELWTRMTGLFFSRLWTAAGMRQRWAIRFRSENQVRKIAEDLGWSVAGSLDAIVPIEELGFTIKHAVLDEFGYEMEGKRERGEAGPREDWEFFGINFRIAKMLDWLLRHEPGHTRTIINSIIGEAEQRFEVPRTVIENSIETALSLDGKLPKESLSDYLERVFPTAE
jgi:hypothetical protein